MKSPRWRLLALFLLVDFAAALRAASPNVEVIGHSEPSKVNTAIPGTLVLAADGTFYGATSGGQSADVPGIFFNVTTSGELRQINTFGPSSGLNPSYQQLLLGADGNFYAAVFGLGAPGEPYSDGALIRVTRDGVSTLIASFNGTGAKQPMTLIAASDGNLYGTSSPSGTEQNGAIFRATLNGDITILAPIEGPFASATVIEGPDGNLYVTVNASNPAVPKILRVTKAGDVSVLHVFDPATEGYPAKLVVGPDGRLYGTSVGGGGENSTMFFSVGLGGDFTVIGQFSFFGLDLFAFSPADGSFYATRPVPRGRAIPPDTAVYKVTPSGVATLLQVYTNSEVLGGLALGPDGNLYGTTWFSGPASAGGIFRLTPSGTNSYIYLFAPADFPATALARASDGTLYGMRSAGGVRHLGDVYRINSDGTQTTIAEFDGVNGRTPQAELTAGADGNLYGTTSGGGTNDLGTIFRVTPSGEITTLASFTEISGRGAGPLTVGGDGSLYVVTTDASITGPNSNNGLILKLVPGGSLQTLFTFDYPDAFYGASALTFGPDGKLYGIGVKSGQPVAYSITPDGALNIIHTFDSMTDGYPATSTPLVLAPAGYFYYASSTTVFRLTLDGQATQIAAVRAQGMTIASDGNLYATTIDDIPAISGRIVRITPDGVVFTLATLDLGDGSPTAGAPVEGSDHRLYGTTDIPSSRAPSSSGEIYRATVLAPQIVSVSLGAGGHVVITGSSFMAATRVSFGGIAATYSVDSDTRISATLPDAVSANVVSITTAAGIGTYPQGSVPPGPAVNISTRGDVTPGDDTLIGGFIVQGNTAKKVMLRALGPSLKASGVAVAVPDPVLELHDGTGALVTSNDDWQSSADKQSIIDSGIAPSDSHESAIVQTLNPGNYTAVVHGAGGVGLVEVYDLAPTAAKLANISTRGHVDTGEDVMIGGFIISGDAPGRVLLRAIGPSLAHATPPVPNALSDPRLELHDRDGNLMALNDDWQEGLQAQAISDTTIAPSDAKESAIIASLNPGNYTAIVRGVNNSTGVALVEVYKLD